ncbi:hypothetical protein PULV_a3053 [Pseudoalteromonas ulvae UL12]|nr:hypothetical protein [Pseudoalteromonas ulvae UL12]
MIVDINKYPLSQKLTISINAFLTAMSLKQSKMLTIFTSISVG